MGDLRGRNVNVTLAWNVMPYIGGLYYQDKKVPATLPSQYMDV